jgi:hypothetical protein
MLPANKTIQQGRISYKHRYIEQTGLLHQEIRREIILTAHIISYAKKEHVSREKSVLKDNTLMRKLIAATTNARLGV